MDNKRTYLHRSGWIWLLALAAAVTPLFVWPAFSPSPVWQTQPLSSRVLSLGEQGALVLAVYGIKLVYMLLVLGILILVRAEQGSAWLALKGSLAAFWMGEFFCAINIIFFVKEILAFEYLHSLFMVYCLGLLFYSVMEMTDKELLHYTDLRARCALTGVCKTCIKAHLDHPVSCLLHRLFKWMIPMAAIIALMPLMAQPLNYSFETRVLGFPRILAHLMPIQWYELRFCPLAALGLMIAAWLALFWRSGVPAGILVSKILLSLAAGHLGFSLMRLAFASFYREGLVWFVFWEELTELLLIASVLVIVLLIRPAWFVRLKESLF